MNEVSALFFFLPGTHTSSPALSLSLLLTSGLDGLVRVDGGALDAADAPERVHLIRGLLHLVQVSDGQVSYLASETHTLVQAGERLVEVVGSGRRSRQDTEGQGSDRHHEG